MGRTKEGVSMREVPISLQIPMANPGKEFKTKVKIIAIDYQKDLSLIEVAYGPLDFVAPVAPDNYRSSGHFLSVGYDRMDFPPKQETATFLRKSATGRIWTREQPWPGRSGGALLDKNTGELVGVVSGFFPWPGGPGVYVSLDDVHAFLRDVENTSRSENIAIREEPQYRNIGIREERSPSISIRERSQVGAMPCPGGH
jgi:hypothetical protein